MADPNRGMKAIVQLAGSVIAAHCGAKVRLLGQWAAATCTAPPSVIATSNCKPLLVEVSL